jgi:hypothetical protein
MSAAPSAGAAYRRWYAAAGPWAGFFRAVPLVALARGAVAPPATLAESPDGLIAIISEVGTREEWLGRPDVLLVLDLPGATSVATAAGLAPWGVRPVVVILLWPEPEALLPAQDLLATLLRHAPRPLASSARLSEPAQYAIVLGRERSRPASPADLALCFDNRYELGAIDLPSAARLRAGGVDAVVACREVATPPAADLDQYLVDLAVAGVPIRRLALD